MLEGRIIYGVGPTPARLLFCGESPGVQEDLEGTPFVPWAPAGRELTRLCSQRLRIDRSLCYITNLIKIHPPGNRDPKPGEIADHAPMLLDELASVRPEVAVPLGRFAARWFLGWPGASMEMCNARAYFGVEKAGRRFTVLPIAHPAGGLRKPALRLMCERGFEALARLLHKGEYDGRHLEDEHPRRSFRHEPDPARVRSYLGYDEKPGGHCLVAIDTEYSRKTGEPWCLTLSADPGSAILIRAGDSEALRIVADHVSKPHTRTLLHNALADLAPLRKMGISPSNVVDTMVDSYLTGIHPQGLKPLGYRLCGVEMHEYEDLLRPYNVAHALRYLKRVGGHVAACAKCGGRGREPGKNAIKKGHGDNDAFWGSELASRRGWTRQCAACKGSGEASAFPPPPGKCRTANSLARSKLKAHAADPEYDLHQSWSDCVRREDAEAVFGPMPEAELDDPPFEEVLDYACMDASITMQCAPQLAADIPDPRVRAVDQAAVPMVERMQSKGFWVDQDYFPKLGEELGGQLDSLSEAASGDCGKPINLSSQDEMAWMLFDHHGIRPVQYTRQKGRGSVDKSCIGTMIERLEGKGWRKWADESDKPIRLSALKLCRQYNELLKLKGTYCDKIQEYIGEDGRLRSSFMLTRIPSGRLATKDPNLLSIPTRTETGRKIRKGFLAEREDWLLGSWDLSQIEIRVLAHRSKDPVLTDLILKGEDFHDKTSEALFGSAKKPYRDWAKIFNFGIFYGRSKYGIHSQLNEKGSAVSLDDCARMKADWFSLYSGVGSYMRAQVEHAKRFGWVGDMFGRRRYLPGIRSSSYKVREECRRQAYNHDIQSTAQGIIKIAMANIWKRVCPAFWGAGYYLEFLLQVHDELVAEFEAHLAPALDIMIKEEMANAVRLRVPVLADGSWDRCWGDLK